MIATTSQTPSPRRWRTLLGATIVSTTILSVAVLSGSGADAARRTSSEVVAAEATRAVAALDRWERTQSPADYVRFVRSRDLAATLTATELEVDADGLRGAWADAPFDSQHAVLAAMSQLGVPYRNLKSEPGVGFDCSGLTIWAFAEAGIELPRVSRDQISAATGIELDAAEPGDLVYYPGHIGIYLGLETYVHSPNAGNDVEAVHLPDKSLRFGEIVGDVGLLVDVAASVAE